ncbi:hypothetical protein ACFC58_06145 [Kitasatospora purpeofusca]|uniref:hypothetical protein n=1 Tax=Kitasatospora purpeofusca TaxID=67352 RepID=UPI0035E2B196
MPLHPAPESTEGESPSGAPAFRPAPGAKSWDVRAVERVMAELSPAPADDTAEGWHVARWGEGVAVQRIMGGHYLRPSRAGAARDEWDGLIRGDREHLAAHGLEILRPGSSQTLVRMPLPPTPQTVARLRRVGPPEEFRRSVSFDGWPEVGGMLQFLPTHASARYEATDHEGREVWVGNSDMVGAAELMAGHYGLPFPVEVVDENNPARPASPAA